MTFRHRLQSLVARSLMAIRRRASVLLGRIVSSFPSPLARVAIAMRLLGDCVPMQVLPEKYTHALELLVAERGHHELGDYLEFGVYQGSSMSCMYRAMESLGLHTMRLIGFDSFSGLPEQADHEDGGIWYAGQYGASVAYATSYLRHHGVDLNRVVLIKGWFEQTCIAATAKRYGIRKAAIINIDCDIYSSTKAALDFSRPFIQDAVVIFFDDWNAGGLAEKGLGERKAFEEFLSANPELVATELTHLAYNANSTAFYVTVAEKPADNPCPAA